MVMVKVIELNNTNESLLWLFATTVKESLGVDEEILIHDIESVIDLIECKYTDAEVVILLYQDDGPTGIIVIDGNGEILNKRFADIGRDLERFTYSYPLKVSRLVINKRE